MAYINYTGTEKYIDPLSDPGFKILFGRESSKDVLIGFLNMLLDGEGRDPITDVRHLDKEKVMEQSDERSVIYDVMCETSCGRRFIVEMQNNFQHFFIDRSLFYMARAITEQGHSGSWRYDYMPVCGIFFSNFVLEGVEHKMRTDVELADRATGKQFTDKLRLIYIQPPAFIKERPEDCENDFERWIYILKNMRTMTTMPFTDMDAVYRRIEEVSRVENLDAAERRRYERELKAYRDYNNKLLSHEEMGEARKEVEIVNNMAAKGLDAIQISDFSGISIERVNEILGRRDAQA